MKELSCLTCTWFISFLAWDDCPEEDSNQGFCGHRRSPHFPDKVIGEGIYCEYWTDTSGGYNKGHGENR